MLCSDVIIEGGHDTITVGTGSDTFNINVTDSSGAIIFSDFEDADKINITGATGHSYTASGDDLRLEISCAGGETVSFVFNDIAGGGSAEDAYNSIISQFNGSLGSLA